VTGKADSVVIRSDEALPLSASNSCPFGIYGRPDDALWLSDRQDRSRHAMHAGRTFAVVIRLVDAKRSRTGQIVGLKYDYNVHWFSLAFVAAQWSRQNPLREAQRR
jgi:hypothetical protein